MIKPDALAQGYGVVTDIIGTYLSNGLELLRIKYFVMDSAIFEKIYGAHSEKSYFWKLRQFYCFSPFIALELSGVNAVEKVRELNGKTDPAKAAEGTIRRKYGTGSNDPTNAVHSSDSVQRALEEIEIIWPFFEV
jgi:nucleoside-diphosphate kinase